MSRQSVYISALVFTASFTEPQGQQEVRTYILLRSFLAIHTVLGMCTAFFMHGLLPSLKYVGGFQSPLKTSHSLVDFSTASCLLQLSQAVLDRVMLNNFNLQFSPRGNKSWFH